MTISDYQIGSVIQTYMKNMKIMVKENEGGLIQKPKNDEVSISREGMRKILYDRIGEQVIERSKKYEQQ